MSQLRGGVKQWTVKTRKLRFWNASVTTTNDMDEGLAWQPSKFNRNSRFLVEWFGDALDDLLAKDMFVERVPFETTHVRLTEAGTLRCK